MSEEENSMSVRDRQIRWVKTLCMNIGDAKDSDFSNVPDMDLAIMERLSTAVVRELSITQSQQLAAFNSGCYGEDEAYENWVDEQTFNASIDEAQEYDG